MAYSGSFKQHKVHPSKATFDKDQDYADGNSIHHQAIEHSSYFVGA